MKTDKDYKILRGKLLAEGYTFADTAKKFGCSKQFVSQSVRMKEKSPLSDSIRSFIDETVGEKFDWTPVT